MWYSVMLCGVMFGNLWYGVWWCMMWCIFSSLKTIQQTASEIVKSTVLRKTIFQKNHLPQ